MDLARPVVQYQLKKQLAKVINRTFCGSKCYWKKSFSDVGPMEEIKEHCQFEHPIKRTAKILKNDIRFLGHKIKKFAGFHGTGKDFNYQHFATHTDILIIGGGVFAESIAFWLKKRAPYGLNVTVISNKVSSISPSLTYLHQQFSLPENVQMSLFGAEFLRDINKYCEGDGWSAVDIEYHPRGNLFLTDENGAEAMKENSKMQNQIGARNVLLSATEIKRRFPWVSTEGIELGCLGIENEGSFNGINLQENLRRKNVSLGTEFVDGEVIGFEFVHQPGIIAPNKGKHYEQIERVILQLPNNQIHAIKFGLCVLADEINSKKIATMARIGTRDGLLSVPLDINCHKKKTSIFESSECRGISSPNMVYQTGVCLHVDGLLGQLHVTSEAVDLEELKWFISQRTHLKNLELVDCRDEYYEKNSLDDNGVLGHHPYYHNLMVSSGFTGHGGQHAPAVGRAMMELIIDGEFKTINLSRFGFDRLCLGEPLIDNWRVNDLKSQLNIQ